LDPPASARILSSKRLKIIWYRTSGYDESDDAVKQS
jgi:hypothetical protein